MQRGRREEKRRRGMADETIEKRCADQMEREAEALNSTPTERQRCPPESGSILRAIARG
jgi:hypothetical protein